MSPGKWLSITLRNVGNYLTVDMTQPSRAGVPKMYSADSSSAVTGSQRNRGYVALMIILKFTYFLIKGTVFS